MKKRAVLDTTCDSRMNFDGKASLFEVALILLDSVVSHCWKSRGGLHVRGMMILSIFLSVVQSERAAGTELEGMPLCPAMSAK